MGRRLGVERDQVGTRLHESPDVTLGPLDHQMHVGSRPGLDGRARRSLRGPRGPDRDRRHEVPVHHIDVDDPRARVEDLLDLRAQRGRNRLTGSTARPRSAQAAPCSYGLNILRRSGCTS